MTLQQAKDEVAKENDYNSWKKMELDYYQDGSSGLLFSKLHKAAELYAEAKAKEAFEAARKLNKPTKIKETEKGIEVFEAYTYPDYEAYLNKKPI